MIRKGFDNSTKFVCWIIARTAFHTNNTCKDVLNKAGKEYVRNLYNFADILHCENPDKIMNEIIEECNITNGNFIRPEKPDFNPLSKVFMRLIVDLRDEGYGYDLVDIMFEVYNNPIGIEIENYSNCLYWQSPECIFECYVGQSLDIMD